MKYSYQGYLLVCLALLCVAFNPTQTKALYGDGCEQYGLMVYEVGGYCQCMAGYVFASDGIGGKYCKDADLVCHDQVGIMSRYDSLSDSCKCSYGYVLSGGRCTNADSLCRSKHGYNSSYSDYDKSCECDSGYTLDESYQCVKKQNNVYYKLLDVDTANRKAIVKSDYDGSQYLISYGYGCQDYAFERYVGSKLVINLGTDYFLDTWDTVVLQDHDLTCNISSRERTYEDSFASEEEYDYSYTPSVSTYTNPVKTGVTNILTKPTVEVKPTVQVHKDDNQATSTATTTDEVATTSASQPQEKKDGVVKRIWKAFLSWFGK